MSTFLPPDPQYVALLARTATSSSAVIRCARQPDRPAAEAYIVLDRVGAQIQPEQELVLHGRSDESGLPILYGVLTGTQARLSRPPMFITSYYWSASGGDEIAALGQLDVLPAYLLTDTGYMTTLPLINRARAAAVAVRNAAMQSPPSGAVHFLLAVEALARRFSPTARVAWLTRPEGG